MPLTIGQRTSPYVLAIIVASCGGSPATGPSSATSLTLHAEVTDPLGDFVPGAGIPSAPDLVHGAVDVANGIVTFTIQFATGTMSAQTTRLTIQIDADQNSSTGVPGGTGVGIDYILDLWAVRAQQTLVQQAQPATCVTGGVCYMDVGTATVTVGTDTMSTTVPLTMLGNASGRMNYRVFAYASPQVTTPTVIADVMPDSTLPPAHVP